MDRKFYINPYKRYSRGAKLLAKSLGATIPKVEKVLPNPQDIVINWGNIKSDQKILSVCPGIRILNSGPRVSDITNKRRWFLMMRAKGNEEIIPPFWTKALDIPDSAYPVVCRTILSGHSGKGIVIANDPSELVEAPLYVKYIPKQQEFRIHVGRVSQDKPAEAFSIQRKARKKACENPNWKVRTHANGFVFARTDVSPPQKVIDVACKAVEDSRIDFGAVDVVWNDHQRRAYVLEINTAPGLEGTTVDDYTKFMQKVAQEG